MEPTAPQHLRHALNTYVSPDLAAQSLDLDEDTFRRQCIEAGITFPARLLPDHLGKKRRHAGLAGQLAEHRRQAMELS